MNEIPEGLEDLLNEIRGGGKTATGAPTPKRKSKEKLVTEQIDPRVLRLIGQEDVSDLDYDTYKTLLKEKMMAGRMSGSQMPTEEVELLTDEFKRVKGKEGRFKAKPKKIKFDNFIGKTKSTAAKSSITKPDFGLKALPSAIASQVSEGPSEEDSTGEIAVKMLSPNIDELQKTMEGILETLKKQVKLDKKEEREEDALETKQKRAEKEKDLEKGPKDKDPKAVGKKVVKPVKGIFDMLFDFIKNILLGGALLFLLNVLKDPAKMLQPFVDMLNGVLNFFNGIIRAINGFIDGINRFVFGPINTFLLNPIHASFNFLEDRINDVIGLFGGDPLNNIPDQPPALALPKIPEIPPYDPFNVLPQNNKQAPPPNVPAQGMAEGGIVLNNQNTFGDVNVQTMSEGGKVNSNTGQKVRGMGADTQMVALQPGEIVMSKPAVQYHGANKLLSMNKEGGGTNVPKQGTVTGMQGGGMVGYGSNLSYKSPVPGYPNYEKPSDSFGQFFAQIYKSAKKYGDPFPEVVAAQAVEESNFGKSMLAKEAFNLFGQDAPPSYPASRKYDYIDPIEGKHTAIKFKSFDESVKYRVKLWKQYYGSAKTPSEAIRNIAAEGYNPHSVYPGKIESVMREYGIVPNLPSPIKSSVTPTTKKVSSEPAVDNRSMLEKGLDWAMTKGRQILGFSNGGIVGGTAGSPKDPKNRKIFLHWTGGFHNGNSPKYHQVFNGAGKPMTAGVNYGVDKNSHTKGANTNSVGLSAAALGHTGMTPRYYDDKKGWAESPLTNAQTTAMAKEAAGLMRAYGQTAADVNKNVMTHGEWERHAVKTGKLPAPVQRWDLDSLTPGPYSHPGGFWSTQQVYSKGGNQMRAKIKSFLSGSPPPTAGARAEFTSAAGVDATNFGVFKSMTQQQRSAFLSSQIGETVGGARVTEKLQFQLQKYQIAEADFKKKQATQAVVSPAEAVTSPSAAITGGPTAQPPSAPISEADILTGMVGPPPSQIAPGQVPSSAAAGGANNSLPNFSSTDSMNTEALVIKSIYNMVG